MTALGYLAGVACSIVVLGSAALVGGAGRRLLVPEWSGAMALLVVLVFGDLFLVVSGELLGSIGLFSRVPIVVLSVVAATAALALASRARGEPFGFRALRPRLTFVSVAAALCVALVLAQGVVAIYSTMKLGITFIDAIEYHLTTAAQFATTHHTTHIVQLSADAPVSYYPFNDELLHGIGIAVFGKDSMSLLLGVVDIGALLLAAWCVGSVDGRGPLALCAVTPIIALLGPVDASAMNDWAATWPLVAGVAVMLRLGRMDAPPKRGSFLIVGAAAGLAAGTKLSSLAPALLLLAALPFCVPRASRWAALLWASGGALLAGGYWYARNFIAVGSPLPTQHIPGLHTVPMPVLQTYAYTVAHYLTNWSVIRHYYLPGLEHGINPLWPVLLGLGAIGVVIAVVRGSTAERMIGAVTTVAVVAYLITPTGALGAPNRPLLFQANLRYAIPALIFAMLLAARSPLSRRWPRLFAGVFLGLLVVKLASHGTWLAPNRYVVPAVLAMCVVTLAMLVVPVGRFAGPLVVTVSVVVLVIGYPLNRSYLHHRYTSTAAGKPALYAALHGQSHTKVGVVGLPGIYPYLGPTYTNDVRYVARLSSDDSFNDYETCDEWRAAVVAGHFRFIAVETQPGHSPPPARAWTQSDPAALPIVVNAAGAVFAIEPGFGALPCESS